MAMMRNDRSPPTDVDTTAKPGVGSTTVAPRAWSWWLAAVFVAPLAAGAFASYELNALWNANEDLSARRDVARRLAGVISTLKDAETGQRGYLLTADPAYLKPYADAIAALPHETAALAESIATIQPEELGPVAQMKAVIDEETAELARTIALAAEGQQAAALAIVRGSLDKRLMDGVRALVAGLEARVDNQIDVGIARRRTLESRCAYGLAATIASTLFLIALLWQSQRQAIQASERLKREMDSRRAAESGREQAFRLEFQARRHAEEEAERRRLAEAHLIDSEQHLGVTLASVGAGFIATDRAGRVTAMNSIAERITGWSQQDGRGRILWDVFDRADRPALDASTNPVDLIDEMALTVAVVHHVIATSRDGIRSAVDVQAALTRRADGAWRGAAIVFRDTTRQDRADTEVQRLAAIVESSSDAIVGKTLEGWITSWNRAAESMFGYSAEEAIGQRVQMLMPKDREHEEMRILADLARGIRIPAFDTVRRTKDGKLFDVSVSISPVHDAQGHIVGASKIARDVTRQRRAEAALRNSEARLRFTLESAQIGDWDLDLSTGEARCSLRHDRCFGYETEQARWNIETFARHVHPDDRVEAVRRFNDAVRERKEWLLECRVIWPDSSVHWISVAGRVSQDTNNSPHMLGIVTDITQQKAAEDARLKAEWLEAENRQILEASRLKSQFLSNMSHELRTPLNAIIGFAELLHSGAVPEDSPKRQLFLGHIATSGHHLLQLINDVLDLSKVESGKFAFFPAPVDLPVLMKDVGDILQTSILRKHLRLSVDIDPTLAPLVLDPGRLKQVLYNYLSNAIKFTPEHGLIQVRAFAEGPTRFRIEVEDNGIGIAAADLPRLFTDFQQLDGATNKQFQGTGLGLALTRRLVQAQGGSVGVRSELGQGSVFFLVLDRSTSRQTGHAS